MPLVLSPIGDAAAENAVSGMTLGLPHPMRGRTVRLTIDAVREVRTRDFYGNGDVVMPAGIAELGSRPHTPPIAPLIEWVKRHSASFGIELPLGRAPKAVSRSKSKAKPFRTHTSVFVPTETVATSWAQRSQ